MMYVRIIMLLYEGIYWRFNLLISRDKILFFLVVVLRIRGRSNGQHRFSNY
jgi:hypothetical protein